MSSFGIQDIRVGHPRRPPDAAKVADLARSIQMLGLLEPLLLTPEGELVSGLHRLEACRALGWSSVPCRVVDLDGTQRELAQIDENLIRRELTALEQAEHWLRREELLRSWGLTRAEIAAQAGLSQRAAHSRALIAQRLAPSIRDTIRHTTVADSLRQLEALARQAPDVQEAVARALTNGAAASVRDALSLYRRSLRHAPPDNLPRASERFRLLHGDLAEVAQQIEPGSVDAVITDPPYPEEYLPLYETLAKVAARVLKPGGSLAVMVGHIYLPEILTLMTPHLTYQWILAYLLGGPSVSVWSRRALVCWKPVLWFVKGEYRGDSVPDVCKSAQAEKEHHEWGQSESGFDDLIFRFTRPGDLVLDPFLGGGTCAVVALRKGRRFIGIDKDEGAIRTATARIAALGLEE